MRRNARRAGRVLRSMVVEAPSDLSRSVLEWVEQLFRSHADGVFNVAYRVLWNRTDAEDVVQTTFVKAFGRIDQLRDPDKARPWLLQVGYRESIAVLRRRREAPVDPADLPVAVSSEPSPDDVVVASAVAAELSKALHRLSPDERMAVVLRDVEDLPMRDVAEVLGVGVSAAKMRVHRGRQRLRSLLADSEVV